MMPRIKLWGHEFQRPALRLFPSRRPMMARVLVLYHSTYGHVEAMAYAQAEGARSAEGTEVDIKRVPELVPDDVAQSAGYKLDQTAPVATINDLESYDAVILGCGTRFGRMASQMAQFLDQAGGLWARGALNGKVGAAFTSTATQHGGQETTLFSMLTNLMHFGMVTVGLPYSFAGQMTLDEITGGSPYGATTITGGQGQRMPSANELEAARFQGRLVAETAAKLHGAYTPDITAEPPPAEARSWEEPASGVSQVPGA
jgi:NAD(P)H dehydrogenase (quinone)